MKATGIIRRVDDLGRVVIPKEIRRTLHIHESDPLELFVIDDGICYKKYVPYEQVDYNIICRALRGYDYAVYDSHSLVRAAPRMNIVNADVPDHWRDKKEVFYDDGKTVIPIVVEDYTIGFVVVLGSGEQLNYVRGVIAAAISAM